MDKNAMTIKRWTLAMLASGVAMWLLAGLWHLVIVPNFYSGGIGAEHHEGGWMISVGYVLLASLMTYMFPLGYQGGKPAIEGLRFGLLIGLLWVTPHALVRAGAHAGSDGSSVSYLLINGVWHLVEQGIGGIIIGLIFGAGMVVTQKVVPELK